MQVHSRASVIINAPRDAVFAFTNDPEKFAPTFRGYGPIPGMVKVENTNGAETRKGTIRNIHNEDGSVLEEHMRVHRPPEEMAYEIVAGLKPPFSWLVKTAGGRWTFEEQDGATLVTWRFRFDLTSPLLYPIGFVTGAILFRKAQERCLAATKRAVEEGAKAAG